MSGSPKTKPERRGAPSPSASASSAAQRQRSEAVLRGFDAPLEGAERDARPSGIATSASSARSPAQRPLHPHLVALSDDEPEPESATAVSGAPLPPRSPKRATLVDPPRTPRVTLPPRTPRCLPSRPRPDARALRWRRVVPLCAGALLVIGALVQRSVVLEGAPASAAVRAPAVAQSAATPAIEQSAATPTGEQSAAAPAVRAPAVQASPAVPAPSTAEAPALPSPAAQASSVFADDAKLPSEQAPAPSASPSAARASRSRARARSSAAATASAAPAAPNANAASSENAVGTAPSTAAPSATAPSTAAPPSAAAPRARSGRRARLVDDGERPALMD